MLIDLAWLPKPDDADRARLHSLGSGADDLTAWRRALAFAWAEADLSRAGRRLGKALRAGDGVADAGVVPVRMLVIASHTFAHMKDAVVASALRHGVGLEVTLEEYLGPEAWLAAGDGRLDDHDLVLVAASADDWRLPRTSDDEAADLDAAQAGIERVLDGLARRGARSVVLQTVVDDLTDLPIHLDVVTSGSRTRLLAGLNDRLGRAAAAKGALVLDVARIAASVGLEQWWAGRFWFSAKFPFAQRCVPLYGDALGRILAARVGKSRRVLVLDLDNTLWAGVIGDDGLEGIGLGQGSAAGEAHLAIQRIAQSYAARGVVLCVASKNTHEVAIEAFRSHPDMVLREDAIAAFQINWNDKASNIRALAQTLNLGLESFVFLDDNPVERKQVRDALPEVAVPEVPLDPADWPPVLQGAGYFEQISFTDEDRKRGQFYKSMAARNQVAAEAGDTDAFLRSLGAVVSIQPFDAMGRKRIAQLISKSNQFNLTTRRYSEAEVERLEADPDVVTMQIRLADIFGDSGMISVVVARREPDHLVIDLWLMSCRVLNRRVQEAALAALIHKARTLGVATLRGDYLPTPKNGIVADHYEALGFRKVADLPDGGARWELAVADHSSPDLPMTVDIAE